MIEQIKKEMFKWYAFEELTDQQVQEFLNEYPEIDSFDTLERSMFANYLSRKIVGQPWPMYSDSEEYKKKFYSALQENAPKFGYKW